MDPQQQNNGFGPLSKPRGNYAVISAAVVIVISVAVLIGITVAQPSGAEESKDKIDLLIFGTAPLILSFTLGELVRRMCLLIEELRHKQTRYEGSWKNVFTSTFTFNYGRSIFVVSILSLLIVCYSLYKNYNTFFRPDYVILFLLNCFVVPQLLFLVGFRDLSIVEISQINEKENKNVADGLAWSYYYGYLKLVLPELENQITKSKREIREKITKKKLFILLPKTCYTYDTIEKSDSRVKCAGALEPLEITRGGILKRPYKHTVHRIEMPRRDNSGEVDEYHVIMEYATPLMSLYDMSKNPEAGLSRQQRDEQVCCFTQNGKLLGEIFKKFIMGKGQNRLLPCTSLSMRGFWVEAPSKSTFDLQDSETLGQFGSQVQCYKNKTSQCFCFEATNRTSN